MAGEKIDVTFSINRDMEDMLRGAGERFDIPDTSKVLRIILDYARADADWDEVIDKVRCRRCAAGPLGRSRQTTRAALPARTSTA